jgi:hypothetical protein
MPEIIAESVDHLCTVDMRPQGMHRGKIHALYDASRRRQEGRLLSLLAAEKLRTAVKTGDHVILASEGSGRPRTGSPRSSSAWRPKHHTEHVGPRGVSFQSQGRCS